MGIDEARAAIRGGRWVYGTEAGRFALGLNNGPTDTRTGIGGRCALASFRRGQTEDTEQLMACL